MVIHSLKIKHQALQSKPLRNPLVPILHVSVKQCDAQNAEQDAQNAKQQH
jgi:hypothetical protein